jgi:L-aspartate oxidase
MNKYDVIVIGSGLAGLNFALRAEEKSNSVLVVTKGKIADSNTYYAQGGIAAVQSDTDNFHKHVRDTLTAGRFHNNKRAVEFLVQHGPAAIERLRELGVHFNQAGGQNMLTREGGHSERRIAFVNDYTGKAIENALVSDVKRDKRITILENTFAAELLVKGKKCYGVRILKGGIFENIFGKIVAIATGGIGQIYENTTNPEIATGDGIAVAARAGCEMKDLEFIQFHPTALKLKGKPTFMISEAVRGEGAYLVNKKGARFMQKVHPLAELAPRDVVAKAIFEEEKKGPVFLDLRHKKGAEIKKRFPGIFAKLKSFGLDLAKDLIPISPAAHYLCGGINVDLNGKTNIANLYAFGETACTGVHGANRLASNSLLEAVVFSEQVPEIKTTKSSIAPKFETLKLTNPSALEQRKIAKLKEELRSTMWKCVGISRSRKSLTLATKTLTKITKTVAKMPTNDQQTLELKNLATASLLIAKAALKRKQSLGCHIRVD